MVGGAILCHNEFRKTKGVARMENVISVRHVRKSFGAATAIKELNLDVGQGEVFGFLGPSGAGKTTTIKILTGQLLPSAGEVQVFNRCVIRHRSELFKSIGVLSDNSGSYERLTVYDNLLLFANIHGVPKGNIDEVLEKVGLLFDKSKQVKNLSKGMKQRMLIARAVLHKPKLLFLDEPTASLDPGTTVEVHKLLRQLNEEGMTIFLTTHNMEEADKLCNRVAFLNEGEIVDMGAPGSLKLKYADDAIKVMLQSQRTEIVRKDSAGGARIKQWIDEGLLVSIHSMEPNLEQIFLTLTGRAL